MGLLLDEFHLKDGAGSNPFGEDEFDNVDKLWFDWEYKTAIV